MTNEISNKKIKYIKNNSYLYYLINFNFCFYDKPVNHKNFKIQIMLRNRSRNKLYVYMA